MQVVQPAVMSVVVVVMSAVAAVVMSAVAAVVEVGDDTSPRVGDQARLDRQEAAVGAVQTVFETTSFEQAEAQRR